MKKRYKYYTDEWCPVCNREVRIPARVKHLPKCPRCKKVLIPCSACWDPSHRNGCVDCVNGSKFRLHPGEKMKKTGFRLDTIIKLADKAYDPKETVVLEAHRDKKADDTLALFVSREIEGTYDKWATKCEQLVTAYKAMRDARVQLEHIEIALVVKLEKERKRLCRKKKSRSKSRSRQTRTRR